MEVLPKAAVQSKPAALTEVEEKSLWDQEEAVLRELRLFLRDMLNKLARDRKFNIFAKPVDDEEVRYLSKTNIINFCVIYSQIDRSLVSTFWLLMLLRLSSNVKWAYVYELLVTPKTVPLPTSLFS